MAQALDERKCAILGAVTRRYIATGEPVSSAWVSARGTLGVCPATVRGEMSELERAGYLAHPHTSAGRVPTDRAYRVYAESIMARAEPARGRRLFANLERSGELEAALTATCRALARLTRYLSLAQPPSWGNDRLRHLQLARLDSRRVLAVVLTESGRAHHAVLEFTRLPTAGQLRALAAIINDRFVGHTLAELTRGPLERAVRELWPRPSFAARALRVLSASLPQAGDTALVIEGGSQLLEAQEFQQAEVARQVFGLIEEQSYLRKLLARQCSSCYSAKHEISVTIGAEAAHPAMQQCALMSATFQVPGGGVGQIGVLGPKRMRYRAVVSALLLAAHSLDTALAGNAPK